MNAMRLMCGCVVMLSAWTLWAAETYYIDDGDADYSELSGSWGSYGADLNDYGNDIRYATASPASAMWAFTNLTAGKYLVYASWTTGGTRPAATAYSATDGIGTFSRSINQQSFADADMRLEDPGGLDAGNSAWFARLGGSSVHPVTDGTLDVTVSASGTLIADAVRLEKMPSLGTIFIVK